MAISAEQLNTVLQTLRHRFPDWKSFDDPDFIAEEIAYKQAAVNQAQKLLSAETLRALVEAGDYEAILQNIKTVGQSTNLLYLSTPNSGDLNVLYREDLDKEAFARAICYLLWGKEDSTTRLGHYLEYVTSRGLPNKWTFPTYFLFLCHPDTDLFIKPFGATKPFLKLIGSELVLSECEQNS